MLSCLGGKMITWGIVTSNCIWSHFSKSGDEHLRVRFLGQKAEWRKVESGPKVALADIQHIKFPKTCFCLSLHCAKFSDINICLLALVSQLLPSPENLQEFSWNLYSFMFLPLPKLPKETQFFGLRQFNYTSFPFEFFHLLFQYLA